MTFRRREDNEELMSLAGAEKRGESETLVSNSSFNSSLAMYQLAKNALAYGEHNLVNTLVVKREFLISTLEWQIPFRRVRV